jgi:hypothetical protein
LKEEMAKTAEQVHLVAQKQMQVEAQEHVLAEMPTQMQMEVQIQVRERRMGQKKQAGSTVIPTSSR